MDTPLVVIRHDFITEMLAGGINIRQIDVFLLYLLRLSMGFCKKLSTFVSDFALSGSHLLYKEI